MEGYNKVLCEAVKEIFEITDHTFACMCARYGDRIFQKAFREQRYLTSSRFRQKWAECKLQLFDFTDRVLVPSLVWVVVSPLISVVSDFGRSLFISL